MGHGSDVQEHNSATNSDVQRLRRCHIELFISMHGTQCARVTLASLTIPEAIWLANVSMSSDVRVMVL